MTAASRQALLHDDREDDAQGEALSVLWEKELDARIAGGGSWESIAGRGAASRAEGVQPLLVLLEPVLALSSSTGPNQMFPARSSPIENIR